MTPSRVPRQECETKTKCHPHYRHLRGRLGSQKKCGLFSLLLTTGYVVKDVSDAMAAMMLYVYLYSTVTYTLDTIIVRARTRRKQKQLQFKTQPGALPINIPK